MAERVHDLIIIGSGPAGLTAGIYAARANLNPLLFDGDKPGGQLMTTTAVENWPGEKSIMGPELMKAMREHAEHFGAQLLQETLAKADFSTNPFTLTCKSNRSFSARSVIIASGAVPRKLNIPGEETYWGKGITTCAICDGAFYKDKKVIVVGGGDTAMEHASFLRKFTDQITIVQINNQLTASHAMQKRVIADDKITIIYSTTLTEILGDGQHVTKAIVTNQETKQEQEINADGIFLAIGLTPSTAPFEGQIELDTYGYVVISDHTKTSVEGVFVAGDAADYRYRQAIVAAGDGCRAALDAERWLTR